MRSPSAPSSQVLGFSAKGRVIVPKRQSASIPAQKSVSVYECIHFTLPYDAPSLEAVWLAFQFELHTG